jgi:hypothetical protein
MIASAANAVRTFCNNTILSDEQGSPVLFEPVEPRQMLSIVSLSGGVLTVTGDSTTTRISVELADSSTIRARTSNLSKTFSRSSVSSIKINGGSRSELISITSQLSNSATIYGNGGNDTIWAGSGNETLYGGDGADQIYGRNGNDKLYGDAGNDLLDGGGGSDLVSGGSGTNTLRSTEGSITSGSTSTPPPVTTGTTGAPVPVITALSTSIAVNQAIHVNAVTSSILNSGTPLTARYTWDFGDPAGKYNKLEGFNAAHAYDTAGTYTIKLSITNEAGKTAVATRTITVSGNSRRKIYVSSLGSDSNNGSSSSSPVRTAARADQLLSNSGNTEVLFRRGDQFTLTGSFVTHGNNVVIGAYGTGNRPQLNISGYVGLSMISTWGTDTVVRDLAFNDNKRLAMAISPHGINLVVRDCQFLNMGDGINCNGKPTGVLAQDNAATLVSGLRNFLIWSQGKDHVFLGNVCPNSVEAQDIRTGGTDRMLVAYNKLTNLDRRPVDPIDFDRQALALHEGSYAWVAHNNFAGGRCEFGPLGGADGLMKSDYLTQRQRWTVVEANTFNDTIDVVHGAEHTVLRNNIISLPDWPLVKVDGYNTAFQRGVVDLNIFNNTVINTGTADNFLKVNGSVDGINLINNVYLAPKMITGSYTAAPVYVADSSLRSFKKITNNVWYVGGMGAYAQGGVNYIWPTWSNSAGYQTPTEWNSLSQVGTDIFSKASISSNYSLVSGSAGINQGIQAPGVFVDFYGKARPSTGAIDAGAVEV